MSSNNTLPEEVELSDAAFEEIQAWLLAWSKKDRSNLKPLTNVAINDGLYLLRHIAAQARRLAEAEVERDAAEAKATRVCRSMLRVGKRLRIARNRVRGIGEELLCARERVGCPASVLFQLCDMRKALGLDLIKTCYTEILPAIQDVVIRAEAAEARVREMEAQIAASKKNERRWIAKGEEAIAERNAANTALEAIKKHQEIVAGTGVAQMSTTWKIADAHLRSIGATRAALAECEEVPND